MLVQKVGAHVIRGSSTHTGARALRDYYETIVKQQISPAITPDGPRGPLHEFKPGAIMLSQITGKPILPIAVACSFKFTFRTWDAFELPLPFSRVAIVYGEPVKVSRAMDADALAGWQQQMGRAPTRTAPPGRGCARAPLTAGRRRVPRPRRQVQPHRAATWPMSRASGSTCSAKRSLPTTANSSEPASST